MFLSEGAFKRLVKKAFKDKYLKILNEGDTYAIEGLWWKLRIDKAILTNKAKAALVEFIGELPKTAEQYDVKPEGNQIEFPSIMFEEVDEFSFVVEKTDFRVGRICLLQNPEDLQIFGVTDVFNDNVSIVFQEDGEDPVDGPYITGKWVTWQNEGMLMQTICRDLKPWKDAIKAMEEVSLAKDEKA